MQGFESYEQTGALGRDVNSRFCRIKLVRAQGGNHGNADTDKVWGHVAFPVSSHKRICGYAASRSQSIATPRRAI